MSTKITRKEFLRGAAAAAAGVTVLGVASCAPKVVGEEKTASENAAGENPVEETAIEPVGTYNCDVAVIGCGVSGLAACVSAAEQGLSVIGLEKSGSTGGGGRGTEGVFGVNSPMQQEQGINVDPAEVIAREMGYFHNRVDGLRWMDLIKRSGDNVAWLKSHGVKFTGTVDNYHGGDFSTFHWFSPNRAAHDYAPPMTAAAEALGVKFLVNTAAEKLIVKDGKVTGVYAKKVNGDYIQVNAKAVIIGTGGFANNNEYLARGHFSNVKNVVRFLSGFTGDGLRMVLEAGGTDRLDRFSGLFQLTVQGAPGGEYGTFGSGNGLVVGSHSGDNIWVNETGERFCAENSGDENWMALMIPTLAHQKTYSIFDRAAFEENVKNIAFPAKSYEEDIAEMEERFATNPYNDAFMDDTIEGLVKKVCAAIPEIKEETLLNTINHYNEMCRNGKDTDFGKPEKYMKELKNPPFYFIYIPQAVMVTFGGIHVNRKFECVDANEKPIPGLYAIGVDSAELWPNVYTINVPGGTNANNINSGRTAAINAAEYIGAEKTGTITTSGDTSPSVVVQTWENPKDLNDGTYTATSRGMFGNITVTVKIQGGKIAEITQTNELETSYIGVEAMEKVLIPAVIDAQDVNVDTVAGATASSNGFRNAVEACLLEAAKK
ncbi:MAG: FAD-binding protein [Chloroflexi bacterium]|nr:FAD-binding protein [Chloroflexota bacterium]